MGVGAWALSFPALASYLPERVRTSIWGTQRNDEVHRKQSISWALSVAACPCPSSLPLFLCSPGCLQQRIQYSLQFVKLILWRDQLPQNPFPSSPFCFLFQQFFVSVPDEEPPFAACLLYRSAHSASSMASCSDCACTPTCCWSPASNP